jgi:hypothetical protein
MRYKSCGQSQFARKLGSRTAARLRTAQNHAEAWQTHFSYNLLQGEGMESCGTTEWYGQWNRIFGYYLRQAEGSESCGTTEWYSQFSGILWHPVDGMANLGIC